MRPITNARPAADTEPVARPKILSFRATGLVLGDAVLGAVPGKPDVTQELPFGGGNDLIEGKRWLKESVSIVNKTRRRVEKMVLDKIYQSGRQSKKILLILLTNKSLHESRVSYPQKSDATETLLVV